MAEIPTAEQRHWSRIRQVRDWSWEMLADYFASNPDPASPDLEKWARAQGESEKPKANELSAEKRAAARKTREAARTKGRGTERAVKTPPAQRPKE